MSSKLIVEERNPDIVNSGVSSNQDTSRAKSEIEENIYR